MVQYVRLVISTNTILFSLRNMYAAFSYGHFSKMSQAMFLFAPAYVLKTGTKPLYTISRLTFFKNDVCLFFLLGELTDCRSLLKRRVEGLSSIILVTFQSLSANTSKKKRLKTKELQICFTREEWVLQNLILFFGNFLA